MMEAVVKAVVRLLALVLLLVPRFAGAADGDSYAIDQMMGKADAPVTILEYASLTCPHCAHFAETTVTKIKSEWVDTGKAKLIYRDFPTGPVAVSLVASMVTHCAGPQRYFGVLDLLFRTQEKWITSRAPIEEIKRIVRLAGIGDAEVDACLQRTDLKDAITARAEDGARRYNIESTPSLVINGKLVTGAQSYDTIAQDLAAAYKAAGGK
jgi:protein-disulfide isomerase